MPAPNLPLEIIDHIINECLPDIESLRASSLISKLWTITAQQRLFSRVSIFPERVRAVPSTIDFPRSEEYSGYPFPQYILDGSIEKFKKHLEEFPHLADFVTELHLGTSKRPSFAYSFSYTSEEVVDNAFTGADEIVARFRELESMSVFFAEDYDWTKLASMHEPLFHAVGSSKLRYLKMGHIVFVTQSQFNELLGNCVALEVLIIDYVKIGAATEIHSETGQEAPEKPRSRLVELTVRTEPQSLSQIVQAFISPSFPVDVSSLTRLSLWCKYPKDRDYDLIGPVCSLLRKTQCLQHLQLFTCLTGLLYQYVNPTSLQTLYVCDQYNQKSSSLSWLARSLEIENNSELELALTELSIDLYGPRGYFSENLSTSRNDWAHLGANLKLHARQLRTVTIRNKQSDDFRHIYVWHSREDSTSEDFRNALGMRWREDVVIHFIRYHTQYEVLYSGSHCEDFYERDEEPSLADWLLNWEIKDDPEGEISEEFQQDASTHPSQSEP